MAAEPAPARWRDLLGLLEGLLPLGAAPRRVRLPIDFLPGSVGVLRRRQPALLLLGDEATRRRCLRTLLETELAEAPVTWLGADEAQVGALGPVVHAAARRGRLRALAWTPGAAAALRERGDGYLLHELAACGLRRRELLVVDLLQPWLADGDAADIPAAVQQASAAVLAWAQSHARAPLLALAPARHAGRALLPLFERGPLPCVAQLQRHGEQTHFEVARWSEGRAGTVQDLGFGLVERADGGWQADGSGLALDTHALVTASDAELVLTLPDTLAGSTGLPPGWKVHDEMAQLVAACRYVVAATVLLPYRGAAELPALVETVRQLRAAHPHALKIVIREVGAQLRYNQELALVRVGANTVVYRAVGFSRLLQTLVELRNQTYSRRIAADDEGPDLLKSVAPDPVRGYLPLQAFCNAAERMLERTDKLGMANCIVQLPLLPHVAHLDALAACRIGRDGDIVSADAQGLWLFLFACRAPDVEPTLKRLFAAPLSELFNQMRVRPEADAMRRAIDRLRRSAVDAVTDYSDALLALQPARLEISDSGFVALQDAGAETMPAPLDEPAAAPPPAREPERFELELRLEPRR